MGIGKKKLGMLGLMGMMAAMGSMDPTNSYTGQGKVGSGNPGKDPEPPKPPGPLRSLLIDDKDVPKGLTKERIAFKFKLNGYIMAIQADVCYTNMKRREQRINSLEREISAYVLGIQFDEILRRGEFEILERPGENSEENTIQDPEVKSGDQDSQNIPEN